VKRGQRQIRLADPRRSVQQRGLRGLAYQPRDRLRELVVSAERDRARGQQGRQAAPSAIRRSGPGTCARARAKATEKVGELVVAIA
jgi:hypothetical protein